MSATGIPQDMTSGRGVTCGSAGAPSEALEATSEIQAEAILSYCADCDVILTQQNTYVTYEEWFWLGVDWTSEQYCATCKDQRAADGPPDSAIRYDPPDTSWYREQLRQAGRGHLLG